ncbi:MAG: 3-phosphoshikimate 1-carboxyvinyltransferase [Gammaproteobacteria bacterium]
MNLISHSTKSLSGDVNCPGDKSISQRILIIGSLLNCNMEIDGFLDAHDPNSTLDALNKIGAEIKKKGNKVFLNQRNISFKNPLSELNFGNSGTGARLMLGFISGLGLKTKLVGDSSLSKRPMSRVILPLEQMGVEIDCSKGTLPIFTTNSDICDNFKYKMPIASAQVKSCLLLAALASKNNINIFEPKITRDHTERMIEFFEGNIKYGNKNNIGEIELKFSNLIPKNYYMVPGDFSSASFIIIATIISEDSEVLIKNVGLNKTRSGLLEVLSLMGAKIEIKNIKTQSNEKIGDIYVVSSNLKGIDVPKDIIPNIIDEIPILSIAAAFSEGITKIRNAKELRVKESDRLNAISEGLNKLKITNEIFDDGISITGSENQVDPEGSINSFDDHRIAMSFLISGIKSKNGVCVDNCNNIETSFPNFKDTMNSLGMNINEKN